jgi:ferric iron reductase protein FhuF
MDDVQKTYVAIDEQMVLFNDEYYLSVQRLDIADVEAAAREAIFNDLYAFASDDMEMEIDISEEHAGIWYLQLLVPHVLTLPETAKKRLQRGMEQLHAYLQEKGIQLPTRLLLGDEIYAYIKRYNPNLVKS